MASEPRFFVLLRDDLRQPHDTDFVPVLGFETGDFPRCPTCGQGIGQRDWLPPFKVEITVHGKEGAGDFVECARSLLLYERMVDAFRSEHLTGLQGFHPVEVVKMSGRAKPRKEVRTRSVALGRLRISSIDNVAEALAEFVEYDSAALEQGLRIDCRLDPTRAAVEQTHFECPLEA